MSLKARITEDMKAAMRAGDKDRLSCIRMLQAGIKQREVDERTTLDDAEVLAVIDKMIRQRRESVAQFEAGKRPDLVAKESAEITLLSGYLPAQLDAGELEKLIREAVAATGASSMKDMGKVMGWLKPKVQGRTDIGALSGRIKATLGG
jgi:uncharacterized protein YqeY